MTTKTLRLPDSLVEAVREIGTAEHVEESTAMRKLLKMGYDLYVAEQYRAGRVSLRDVAARMNLPLSETLEALRRLGITGNTGADDALASLQSISNLPR
jgi:hypothetical protein